MFFEDAAHDFAADVDRMRGTKDAIPGHLRANLVGTFFGEENGAALGGNHVKNEAEQNPRKGCFVTKGADGAADLQQGAEIALDSRGLRKQG